MARKYRGTIAELVAQGITINGVQLDANMFSTITRLNLARSVGNKVKQEGQRGPAATIWEIDSSVTVELVEVPKAA